jgi:hypothetical protein
MATGVKPPHRKALTVAAVAVLAIASFGALRSGFYPGGCKTPKYSSTAEGAVHRYYRGCLSGASLRSGPFDLQEDAAKHGADEVAQYSVSRARDDIRFIVVARRGDRWLVVEDNTGPY